MDKEVTLPVYIPYYIVYGFRKSVSLKTLWMRAVRQSGGDAGSLKMGPERSGLLSP